MKLRGFRKASIKAKRHFFSSSLSGRPDRRAGGICEMHASECLLASAAKISKLSLFFCGPSCLSQSQLFSVLYLRRESSYSNANKPIFRVQASDGRSLPIPLKMQMPFLWAWSESRFVSRGEGGWEKEIRDALLCIFFTRTKSVLYFSLKRVSEAAALGRLITYRRGGEGRRGGRPPNPSRVPIRLYLGGGRERGEGNNSGQTSIFLLLLF